MNEYTRNWDPNGIQLLHKIEREIGEYEIPRHLKDENDRFLALLLKAAPNLMMDDAPSVKQVPVSFVTAPILNACAVWDGSVCAIALSLRLKYALLAANRISFRLRYNDGMTAGEKMGLAVRLRRILRGASRPEFPQILQDNLNGIQPNPLCDFWAVNLTKSQMLFVLLHEYAHLFLGHTKTSSLWEGYPIVESSAKFFTSSIEHEHVADEAAYFWMDRGDWDDLLNDFLFADNNALFAIMRLFAWFHVMMPRGRNGYYEMPRSHPHPLDRADHLVRKYHPWQFESDIRDPNFLDLASMEYELWHFLKGDDHEGVR